MAHEFTVQNTSGTITTYTDYDTIPTSDLKYVIKFIPDLGTKVPNNEVQLESGTVGYPGRIVPENWSTYSENHLVLETASDTNVTGHYHESMMEPHTSGDGHTEAEHREIELWGIKFDTLITAGELNGG